MRRRIALSGAVISAGFAFAAAAAAQDLYVSGPVDAVDTGQSRISVLGQDIRVSRAQLGKILAGKLNAAGSQIQVLVSGPITDGRIAAKTLVVLADPYVAGASDVAILGYVTKVNGSVGRASIGRLNVDLSALSQPVRVGDLVELAGTQPMLGGTLVAVEFRAATNGSIGSGTAGSIGSGTAGSIGSGTAGSIGSGTAGSIGSGTAGSIGSGTAGSIGSGTAGSIGSGTAGSIGSGTAGSIGSGTAGSIGSGTAGSIGSGTAGSIGSGTAGSIGSGTAGSIGSGTAGS
ncbi:MAG: hypothetical protein AB7V24_14470, partial [Steroidobacteraceae bacterium]